MAGVHENWEVTVTIPKPLTYCLRGQHAGRVLPCPTSTHLRLLSDWPSHGHQPYGKEMKLDLTEQAKQALALRVTNANKVSIWGGSAPRARSAQ